MSKKILISSAKAAQFNIMLSTLKRISKDYQNPTQLRKNCERLYGLQYEEALEMAYENIQIDASSATHAVKPIIL